MGGLKSEHSIEQNLESKAEFFNPLGHSIRLLTLNLLKMRFRDGEGLSTILNLKPAAISHHLAKLSEVGLLESEKE
jgi:DNA-binding transcriptional ArsR family regulator